jgi:integrase
MLAILFGCGLRRSELVGLKFDDVQVRQGHWAIVDLVGKGGHIRTVPIPNWAKAALDLWIAAAGIAGGRMFRAVARTDRKSLGQRHFSKRRVVCGQELLRKSRLAPYRTPRPTEDLCEALPQQRWRD